MIDVVYLGPDVTDYAVERRVRGLMSLGRSVRSYTFRRNRHNVHFRPDWDDVSLGIIRDRAYVTRSVKWARALKRVHRDRSKLSSARCWYARNLDMLLLARVARRLGRARGGLIYEVLDIRPSQSGSGVLPTGIRAVERWALRGVDGLAVSSPAFIKEFYERRQTWSGQWRVIENRVMPSPRLSPRPADPPMSAPEDRLWRIGWFGTLRCERSLSILAKAAAVGGVEVVLAGKPSRIGEARFAEIISGCPNITMLGEYRSPQDLAALYGNVDVSWAIDLADPDGNSDWLLPNRLYEAGYFATPSVTLRGQFSDRFARERGWSLTLDQPTSESLQVMFASHDLGDRWLASVVNLLTSSVDAFLSSDRELASLVEACER